MLGGLEVQEDVDGGELGDVGTRCREVWRCGRM